MRKKKKEKCISIVVVVVIMLKPTRIKGINDNVDVYNDDDGDHGVSNGDDTYAQIHDGILARAGPANNFAQLLVLACQERPEDATNLGPGRVSFAFEIGA